jgi:glycosidase
LPKALKELPSTAIIFMVCACWGGGVDVGYWETDFVDVNGHFGTAEDIVQLALELHKREMVHDSTLDSG